MKAGAGILDSPRTWQAAMAPFWLAMLLFGAGLNNLPAQTNGGFEAARFAEPEPQLKAKLAAAQEDLDRVLAMRTNLPPGATAGEFIEYRGALQRVARAYQSQIEVLAAVANERARAGDIEQAMRSWTGFAEPPPYSVLQVDELRNTVHALGAKIQSEEVALKLHENFLADAELAGKETDKKIRRIDEQIESAKRAPEAERLSWLRELEHARYRDEVANMGSHAMAIKLVNEELTANRQSLAFSRRQLALASQHVCFPQADLDKVLEGLDAEHRELEAGINTADQDLTDCRQALEGTREKLRQRLSPDGGVEPNGAGAASLRELAATQEIQMETAAERLSVLRQRLANLATLRQMWQLRFTIFDSHKQSELEEGAQRLSRLANLIDAAKPYYQEQLRLVASQITAEQTRRQGLAGGTTNAIHSQARLESYQQREEALLQAAKDLERGERFISCWEDSLMRERQALPLAERVKDLFSGASNFLGRLWHFEVYVVDDTITLMDGTQVSGRRGVTVGKICLAMLIFLIGYWLIGVISRFVEPIALRRLKIERNQASLVRRWVRVALVIVLVVFSLKSVNIPLAVFAFAGGALAIGIGFGTQTLLKNFISGIILLFERPFRVGDVVDVQGQCGTVSTIGVRSCVVHLWDGKELLIPNSVLLENIVTNWTYSHQIVRFTLSVGVACGSDTQRVAELLAGIAGSHQQVEKTPPPEALLMDLGDSAWKFELRYWLDVMRWNHTEVASDLRHGIAACFAENQIKIAFPQRDVHLDANQPLRVELLPAGPNTHPIASRTKNG